MTAARLAEPGLEGLGGRHRLRRRVAGPHPDRARRGAGLRLRGLPRPGGAWRDGRGTPTAPTPATARRGAAGALRPGLLAARPRVLRPGARRRQAPGRRTRLEHRPVLWTGIARPSARRRGHRSARRRCSPAGASGPCRRRSPAYNPMSYQCGSVWPHDTAIAVAGLARYGHRRSRPADRAGAARRRGPPRRPVARALLRVVAGRCRPGPWPTPPRARRRPGRRRLRCCCCGPCSGSSRTCRRPPAAPIPLDGVEELVLDGVPRRRPTDPPRSRPPCADHALSR